MHVSTFARPVQHRASFVLALLLGFSLVTGLEPAAAGGLPTDATARIAAVPEGSPDWTICRILRLCPGW